MSDIKNIYDNLSFEERKAVDIIKAFLDLYNNAEGTGLFKGESRYPILTGRIKIAAYKSQTLLQFWSNLIRGLNCDIHFIKNDEKIFSALLDGINIEFEDELSGFRNRADLKIISTLEKQAEIIVMIARSLHSEEKEVKKSRRDADKSHLDGFKAIIESENSSFQIDRYLNDLLAEENITAKESVELKKLFLSTIKAKETGLNQMQIDSLAALKQFEFTDEI